MEVNGFIKFKFMQAQETYIGLITFVDNESFDCQFLGYSDYYTFDSESFRITSTGGMYPTGSRLSSYTLFNAGDNQKPIEINDFIAVTFSDNGRFLGQVTDVDSFNNISVKFLHSGQSLVFDTNNKIVNSDNPQDINTFINGTEAYIAEDPTLVISASDSDASAGVFTNGLWSLARQVVAYRGRIGGVIKPFATVVHTTDESPDAWDGRIDEWTSGYGQGECAHFLIGRTQEQGVVQFGSIFNNANHAGGPGHGTFITSTKSWEPNNVSVGIEVHCNGRVKLFGSSWKRYSYDSANKQYVAHGTAVDAEEVILDPKSSGFGWHKVTDYQLEQLGLLLDGLETVLDPLPTGCVATSIERPPAYGVFTTGRVVGHVSLHAASRGDPWPQVCDWIRSRS